MPGVKWLRNLSQTPMRARTCGHFFQAPLALALVPPLLGVGAAVGCLAVAVDVLTAETGGACRARLIFFTCARP